MKLTINLSKPTKKKLMLGDKLSLDKKIFHKVCGLGWNKDGELNTIKIDYSEGEIYL